MVDYVLSAFYIYSKCLVYLDVLHYYPLFWPHLFSLTVFLCWVCMDVVVLFFILHMTELCGFDMMKMTT